jgi:uncharacterized protein involved in high-affinity Fe2+ transport
MEMKKKGNKYENSNADIPMGLGIHINKDGTNNFSNKTKEQKREWITQYLQAESEEQMGQLIDRKASNNFQ